MREYNIYIIQKEIAYEYYGIENKLFQLFEENYFSKGKLKEITNKQIQYIIEKIPVHQLEEIIFQTLKGKKEYKKEKDGHIIYLTDSNSYAKLFLDEWQITLLAKGTYDAEARFYEILREYYPFFMALEFTEKRYGWLKPLKFNVHA